MIYDEAVLRDVMRDTGYDPVERELRLLEYLSSTVAIDGQYIYTEAYIMEKITLRIDGMSCGHCEIAVQDAVRKLSGIKKVKASKRRREAVVEYDAALVTREQIVKSITASGYTVVS